MILSFFNNFFIFFNIVNYIVYFSLIALFIL